MAEHSDENKSTVTGFTPATAYVASNSGGAHASVTGSADNKGKHRRRVVIIVVAVVAVLVICYFVGFFIFSGRFFPNTTVSNLDISMDTPEEAAVALENSLDQYELSVEGQGLDFTISAEQAGLALDAETITKNMMSNVNPWVWPVAVFQSHNETDSLVVTYSEDTVLSDIVRDKVNEFNSTAIQPENATVVYNEPQENFTILDESIGTALDVDKIIEIVSEKAMELDPNVTLDESVLLQPRVMRDNEDLIRARDNANTMVRTNFQVEMADTVMGEVTPSLIASWITFVVNEGSSEDGVEDIVEEPAEDTDTENVEQASYNYGKELISIIEKAYADEVILDVSDEIYEGSDENTDESTDENADGNTDEDESIDEGVDENADEYSDVSETPDTDENQENVVIEGADEYTGEDIDENTGENSDAGVDENVVDDNALVSLVLNEDAIYNWSVDVTKNCDTVGSTRTYTRPDGKEITVAGGSYGWNTDTNGLKDLVIDSLYSNATGVLEIPVKQTGAVFNGVGAQDWGARYVDIDLSEQHVYFYDSDSSLIWDSACVSGLPNGSRNTPTGVYYIYSKERNTYLEDEAKTYKTFVSYWMPFNGGVGLHDANWQPAFGGSQYKSTGSHGCVNLPPSAAANLYSIIEVGDVVVCNW